MNVNENTMDLTKHRGPVQPCPVCTTLSDAAKLDAMSSGKACSLCFNRRFVAYCLNCGGTGQYRGRTIWDGGRSEYASTCTPCGGTGVFPVARPADWSDKAWAAEVVARNASVCRCTHTFGGHSNHRRSPDDPQVWTSGRCSARIGVAICPCEGFDAVQAVQADAPKDVEPVPVNV